MELGGTTNSSDAFLAPLDAQAALTATHATPAVPDFTFPLVRLFVKRSVETVSNSFWVVTMATLGVVTGAAALVRSKAATLARAALPHRRTLAVVDLLQLWTSAPLASPEFGARSLSTSGSTTCLRL